MPASAVCWISNGLPSSGHGGALRYCSRQCARTRLSRQFWETLLGSDWIATGPNAAPWPWSETTLAALRNNTRAAMQANVQLIEQPWAMLLKGPNGHAGQVN